MAYLITTDSTYRHPIQALVSTGQFYGDALYYLTSLFDDFYAGKTFYRPEPYYFWFYFVFMNAFWLIVPACKWNVWEACDGRLIEGIVCFYSSIRATAKAFAVEKRLGINGSAKKTL
jgi:cholestenol delta-isomerase